MARRRDTKLPIGASNGRESTADSPNWLWPVLGQTTGMPVFPIKADTDARHREDPLRDAVRSGKHEIKLAGARRSVQPE